MTAGTLNDAAAPPENLCHDFRWAASALRKKLPHRFCSCARSYAGFITGEVFNVNGGAVLVG